MKAPIYEEPDDPDKDAYYVEQYKWKYKYDSYKQISKTWKENDGKLFNFLLRHYTPEL